MRTGSENIDYRLRNADFTIIFDSDGSALPLFQASRKCTLVVGSNLRKDHPLFALRIRQSIRNGCVLSTVNSLKEPITDAWAMPVSNALLASSEKPAQSAQCCRGNCCR
jgi:NADH-quinone oxidoreductase subunit G